MVAQAVTPRFRDILSLMFAGVDEGSKCIAVWLVAVFVCGMFLSAAIYQCLCIRDELRVRQAARPRSLHDRAHGDAHPPVTMGPRYEASEELAKTPAPVDLGNDPVIDNGMRSRRRVDSSSSEHRDIPTTGPGTILHYLPIPRPSAPSAH